MGGLGSGRTRRHTCIDDCLTIDTTWLRRHKMLPGQQGRAVSTIEWRKWTETDFISRREHTYRALACPSGPNEEPALLLHYQAELVSESGSKKQLKHTHRVNLIPTTCYFGNVRWWFACPHCGRRSRVLYINPKCGDLARMTPQCRLCADLHYASQMQSYIEKHKSYERHLLANYGLYWASYRYDYELKEHYLKMTPELWALRLKSVVDWNLHLLKRIIQCDLAIYRTDLRIFKSLRSEEDRRICLEQMQARQQDTLHFVKVLFQCTEYERLLCRVNTHEMPDSLFELYSHLVDVEPSEQSSNDESALEQKIIHLETILQHVQAAEKKARPAA